MTDAGRPRFAGLRSTQVVFVALLLICIIQTGWWLLDQAHYTARNRDERIAILDREADRLEREQPAGTPVDRSYRERLDEERAKHMTRYGWEGAFFVVVLAAGMWIIAQALKQWRQLMARQQDLLAAVTHEFKNPLASLKLSAETLGIRPQDDAKRQLLSQRMLQEVDRLETMVENLLGVARLEAGHVQVRRDRVVLGPLANDLVRHDPFLAADHGVAIHVDAAEGVAAHADPRSVKLVITNLVDNAVKSSVAQGGSTVRVTAARDGDRVRLDVDDDGLGFDAEQRRHLFARFWRADDELRRRTRGTGLGLYLVERLVKLDGGRVDASSAGLGRGARFSVWWPVAKEAA